MVSDLAFCWAVADLLYIYMQCTYSVHISLSHACVNVNVPLTYS